MMGFILNNDEIGRLYLISTSIYRFTVFWGLIWTDLDLFLGEQKTVWTADAQSGLTVEFGGESLYSIEIMNFALNMMNFVMKMMNVVLKMMEFALQMMNFLLKKQARHSAWRKTGTASGCACATRATRPRDSR